MSTSTPEPPVPAELRDWLRKRSLELGFCRSGVTSTTADDRSEAINRWLQLGYQAEMNWFAESIEARLNIRSRFPESRSILVFASDYDHSSPGIGVLPHLSRYARGRDYHTVLGKRLKKMAAELRTVWHAQLAWTSTDSGPIAEKPAAIRAGLGWLGRSGNLIHPDAGSYFFLAVIVTDLDFGSSDSELPDLCGKCTACVDACPTGAIRPERMVDSSRCLSYLTIEWPRHRMLDDLPIRNNHGWLHGCDDCQEVCPWVQRARRRGGNIGDAAFVPLPRWLDVEAKALANLPPETLSALLQGSPVARQGVSGLYYNMRNLHNYGWSAPGVAGLSAGSVVDEGASSGVAGAVSTGAVKADGDG